MHGPPGSGFLVEPAVTIHDGAAFVIASQDPTGTAASKPTDRAAFRTFLAGIGFQRQELDWRPWTCQVGGFSRSGQAANRG